MVNNVLIEGLDLEIEYAYIVYYRTQSSNMHENTKNYCNLYVKFKVLQYKKAVHSR